MTGTRPAAEAGEARPEAAGGSRVRGRSCARLPGRGTDVPQPVSHAGAGPPPPRPPHPAEGTARRGAPRGGSLGPAAPRPSRGLAREAVGELRAPEPGPAPTTEPPCCSAWAGPGGVHTTHGCPIPAPGRAHPRRQAQLPGQSTRPHPRAAWGRWAPPAGRAPGAGQASADAPAARKTKGLRAPGCPGVGGAWPRWPAGRGGARPRTRGRRGRLHVAGPRRRPPGLSFHQCGAVGAR